MSRILEVSHVSKQYEGNTQPAVQDVSFSLEQGQILTLTGESGSGKTTLLKIIAGLIEADQGKVYLHDNWVKGPSRKLVPGHPDIKMVYQHYELSPNLNVRQNIMRILRAYVKEYQHERATELLEICKLSHLSGHYPRELSGGEKQRVALARAIAEEPVLLLMDEPFSNIDLSLKAHLKREINGILEALNITAIIVSHDPQDALSMADTVAVMRHGELLQMDSPENVYTKPSSAYVAQLFGHCNMINTTALKKAFEVPDDGLLYGIRAEDLHITKQTNQRKSKIKSIRFMGAFYEVTVEIAQQSLMIHQQVHHSKVGDIVYLEFTPEKLISMPIPKNLT